MFTIIDFSVSFHEAEVEFAVKNSVNLILKYFVSGSGSQAFIVKDFGYFFQTMRAGDVKLIDTLMVHALDQ